MQDPVIALAAARTEAAAALQDCCAPVPMPAVPDDAVEPYARMLKALGHPVRLRMLHLLSRPGGALCVCDLEAQFALSQPTISHHLRLLREAGLVEGEQRGPWVHYRVRPAALGALAAHVAGLAGAHAHGTTRPPAGT